MSYFNTELNEIYQFIVGVKVADCFTDEQYQDGTANLKFNRATPRRALIDTGAGFTSIGQEIADELGLGSMQTIMINTANEPYEANLYTVDLAIAGVKKTKFEKLAAKLKEGGEGDGIYRRIEVTSMPKVDKYRGFDILLGMDILSQMRIAMSDGKIYCRFSARAARGRFGRFFSRRRKSI